MSIRPPEYKPPPRTTYTDFGWIFAALSGPVTLLAVWIYCAVTYGFFLGLRIGLDSRSHPRIAGCRGDDLFMAVGSDSGSILIYRVFGVHPELLIYIAALVGIIAIAMIWWRHAGNNKL
jgi:hypothetical protein